ncbi:MAG: DUF481 domain-containing protein [Gammaproteobacteria bacterium]|nr:DUF481 domain-containing protein [Gammaproteobacteria bacterium]
MRVTRTLALVVSTLIPGALVAADNEWSFGVGSGVYGLNIDGDVGLTTLAGPVTSSIDVDFDDILDLSETAIAVAGFANKGRWTIDYAFAVLELSGNNSGSVLGTGVPFRVDVTFKATTAATGVAYQLMHTNSHQLQALAGIRYTEHDLDMDVLVGPVAVGRDTKEDWLDGYIGLSYQMKIASDWSWKTKVDIGAGGSDLSTTINTALAWNFSESWVTSLYGNYYSVDYENGNEGDSDWYEYDADEFGVGLSITYLW